MHRYLRAIASASVATMVLSVTMLAKSHSSVLPAFSIIDLLAGLAHGRLGLPMTPTIGWIAHLLIGTVLWGVLFAFCYPALPGRRAVSKAMVFATCAWVLMMFVLMPMAGHGWFGLRVGPLLPLVALALHWIWGLTLGITFGYAQRLRVFAASPRAPESGAAASP